MSDKVILNNVFPNAAYMTSYENLGHETINLFKADDGKYYVYLNAYGNYNGDEPVDVLNLSRVADGLYQVVSKAVNCTVCDEVNKDKTNKNFRKAVYDEQKKYIKYGGISVDEFFKDNITMSGNNEKEGILATFDCKGIYEPKKAVYIAFNNTKSNTNGYVYKLEEKTKFSSGCRIINLSNKDSETLCGLICNCDLWNSDPVPKFEDRLKEFTEQSQKTEENYFSFLGVDKQELQYSNALIKILKFDSAFLSEFLSKLSDNKDCKNNKFEILREEKSIDLLFRDLDKENGKIFIIENKIDAKVTLSEEKMNIKEQVKKWINKIENVTDEEAQGQSNVMERILRLICEEKEKQTSQLSKYYIIAVYWALKAGWNENKIREDIYCYFLCPEYHQFNYKTKKQKLDMALALSEKYQLITYKKILEIFKDFSFVGLTNHQKFLLNDFISAISMLAKERDDSMELKMIRLFIERYEKIKTRQGQTP